MNFCIFTHHRFRAEQAMNAATSPMRSRCMQAYRDSVINSSDKHLCKNRIDCINYIMKFPIQLILGATFGFSFLITTVNAQTRQTPRPEINRLVDKLKKEDEVHFGYPVGYAGIPETNNKYYKLYLK